MSGSAVVRRDRDDAVARALLDATNRRLARAERGNTLGLIRHRAAIRANLAPMQPVAVQLSYRLGGADGVAVEARKWEWALHELGFSRAPRRGRARRRPPTRRRLAPVPRHRSASTARAPEPDELAATLAGADLVIVENLCSLPINPDASTLAAEVLAEHDGRVVFHHHDLPWQRAGLADARRHPAAPAELAARHHQRPLARAAREPRLRRGHAAQRVRPRSARAAIATRPRAEFGFAPDDLVLLQPTRAIPRKNIPAAIAFATELARREPDRNVRLWITGPAEDGYDDVFARARRRVGRCRSPSGGPTSAPDAYAAADLVLFPSTWEGFGNPVIESIAHRRADRGRQLPGARRAPRLRRAPAVDRRRRRGAGLAAARPIPTVLERNVELVRPHCSLADLPQRIDDAFDATGWDAW